MNAPSPVQDIHAGIEAFARDLKKVLKDSSLVERGWAMPDDMTLLVPLFASYSGENCDAYLLRLVFDHYSEWPPSAQFINPLTMSYTFPDDVKWVPNSEQHQEIRFHTNYSKRGQLICSSTTLEFYKVNHSVKEEHLWRAGQMTFMSTIAAIKSGMSPQYYKGRSTE